MGYTFWVVILLGLGYTFGGYIFEVILLRVYDRVDREALWNVLYIYGVGGQLLKGIQSFYREANACVRVGGEFSESFAVEVGVITESSCPSLLSM